LSFLNRAWDGMSYWQENWCWQGLTEGGLVRRGKPTQPSLANRPRGAFELWG
jgi:hypothetical protein